MRRPVWYLYPAEISALLLAYLGRAWPTPVDVADWLADAEYHAWDIRPWPKGR